MRPAVRLGSLIMCFGCRTGTTATSTLVVPQTFDTSGVEIAATAVDGTDESGSLLVLIMVKNTRRERLVVIGGGSEDDWFSSLFLENKGGTSGCGEGIWSSDGAVPGHISCPSPAYDLIVPPGHSIGRLQRVRFDCGIGGVSRMQMDIRLFFGQASLRCGPLGLLERKVDVALEPAMFR